MDQSFPLEARELGNSKTRLLGHLWKTRTVGNLKNQSTTRNLEHLKFKHFKTCNLETLNVWVPQELSFTSHQDGNSDADSDIFGKSGGSLSFAKLLSANVVISLVGAKSGGPMLLFHG